MNTYINRLAKKYCGCCKAKHSIGPVMSQHFYVNGKARKNVEFCLNCFVVRCLTPHLADIELRIYNKGVTGTGGEIVGTAVQRRGVVPSYVLALSEPDIDSATQFLGGYTHGLTRHIFEPPILRDPSRAGTFQGHWSHGWRITQVAIWSRAYTRGYFAGVNDANGSVALDMNGWKVLDRLDDYTSPRHTTVSGEVRLYHDTVRDMCRATFGPQNYNINHADPKLPRGIYEWATRMSECYRRWQFILQPALRRTVEERQALATDTGHLARDFNISEKDANYYLEYLVRMTEIGNLVGGHKVWRD